MEISLQDAGTRLGELIDRAEAGEPVCITRDGKPAAELSAFAIKPRPLKPIDIEALRAFTATLPASTQSAEDLVRSMRDESPY
jgi:antitoxin (DNA-binding transcriptional repressor) of toxin-antitoxin stability system